MNLVNKVKKLIPSCDRGSNSHYIFTTGYGELVVQQNDVCFYRLKSHGGIIKARVIITQHLRDNFNFKVFDRWRKWVTRESYWKGAFLNPKGKVYSEGISLNTDKPHSYIVAGSIAIREGWEYHENIKIWDNLVTAGVNPHIAHAVAFHVWVDRDNSLNILSTPVAGGHGCLPKINKSILKAYRNEEYKPDKNSAKKNASMYYVFSILQKHGARIDAKDDNFNYVYNKLIAAGKKRKKGWNTEIVITMDSLVKVAKEIDNECT